MKDQCTHYLKPFTKRLIIGPIFKLIEAIFELIVPILMALIIDEGVKYQNKTYIYSVGAIIIVLGILGLGSSLVCQFNASRASQGYGTLLRNAIFRKINSLSPKELEKVGSDALINIMSNDINQLQLAVAMLIRLVVRAPFLVLGSLIAACIINLKIGIIFLVMVIFIALILYFVIKASSKRYTKVQDKLDDLSVITSENLKGAREVRGFAMQAKEEERFEKEVKKYQKEALTIAKISALLNPLTTIVANFSVIAILYFGGRMVEMGTLSQGEVIALVNYMNQILLALIVVSNLVVIFTKAYASLKRCDALLSLDSSIENGSVSTLNEETEDLLVFQHVSFAYDVITETSIEDISFTLKKGQTLGIIGGTGSGKSTIVQLIERYFDVTTGAIDYSGKPIQTIDLHTLRSSIGLVQQKAVLFKGTIRSNLQMAAPMATDEEMMKALEVAQAVDFVLEKGGLDSVVEENGRNFSGGQKQRISIAMALVKQPKLLILDDSTSALDYMTDAKVRKGIRDFAKDMTCIIISQRASSLKEANQILVLDEGKMMGMGTHQSLIDSCEVYQEICASQESRGEEYA
ncbi:MAG: ABC transporter ATP-binding protein/permease [Prevotella sp.]|nr:ABC transporter ATP-binding protein/permease [Staphylococcus sp.]MCM1350045.1 ABC transporter ATP-binding protein/permease [Prevotella sp.]